MASTIAGLLALSPFYIAHRGSGDNWAEHTMDAYTHSVDLGARAIEISVNATKDGMLVCHHDTTMERTSGKSIDIADMTWAELSALRIDAREWLGPSAALQPIPLLSDVLQAFAATQVVFVEDKQGTNTAALLDAMDATPAAGAQLVWKQWAGAGQYKAAAERGFQTWGYLTPDIVDRAADYADRFDLLGVHHSATDEQVRAVVSLGKPVIAWEIHFRWQRDRMRSLGVAGMMCSNIPYVEGLLPAATSDQFPSGLRAAGDLPWTIDAGWAAQPALNARRATIRLARPEVQSYLMGSMCPVTKGTYELHAEFGWPDALPASEQHVGLAFAVADDRTYRVTIPGESAGYHAILRADGQLELYRRESHVASGTLLGRVSTAEPHIGEWISLTITVSSAQIAVKRTGESTWSVQSSDTSYRGGYIWLCKNYADGPPVEFRRIRIT
ncbi:glycerophosphodiester phosphodiesterase family protein [Homoserinimonas sp. OAct 916]|uniref:glycerophosphodiester phosphodiesterase n=1 Tax=Homoserinimonas sp. OAct 916 TaxID=2211450 RepID=UPI000DBE09AB|nr:glycerophosphodiester phosphodiesterase family protein [Homoserinimonas sp. OAct 916]